MKDGSRITVRVDAQLLDEIDDYANAHTGNNRSAAVKRLLEAGLIRTEIAEQYQQAVESLLKDHLEQMFKVASRGTKASLATLVMATTYLPATAAVAEETGRLVADSARRHGDSLPTAMFDDACAALRKVERASTDDVMDWCWRAAGRIQTAGSRPTYTAATKGLSVHKEPTGPDFWMKG